MSTILRLKPIFLLLFTSFLVNCTTNVVRVPSPLTANEKKSHGLVGLGIFANNPNHGVAMSGLFDMDSGSTFTNGQVTFSEVLSKDLKNNSVKISPYGIEEPIALEEVNKIQYLEGKVGYLAPFFVVLTLDPKKEYIISNFTYTYTVNCGQNCTRTVIRNFALDPVKSYKALPISAKGGELKFLGVHMGTIERTTKENPYGIEDDNKGITELFSEIKVAMEIEDAESFIKARKSDTLREVYYNNSEVKKQNAEIKFLDAVIKAYDSNKGYWHELATKKRASIQ
ncbi:MAG: hypothetical protein MH321_16625 [Leptospiraceae bacterium]|nr:hypothetical protein [Leptospiraceae bacterium]